MQRLISHTNTLSDVAISPMEFGMVEANPHDQLSKYTAQTQGINATSQLYRLSQSLHMNVEQKHLAVERFKRPL